MSGNKQKDVSFIKYFNNLHKNVKFTKQEQQKKWLKFLIFFSTDHLKLNFKVPSKVNLKVCLFGFPQNLEKPGIWQFNNLLF